jgi:hypothetical protein
MSDSPSLRVSYTTNYNLNLPDVGGDWDEWGDLTNQNWNFVDTALLPIWGGVMTGFLTLYEDPTQPLGAATKQYVDAVRALMPGYLPLTGGTLAGQLITAPIPGGGANVSLGIGSNANGFWSSATALILQAGGVTNTAFGAAINVMSVPLEMTAALTLQADPVTPTQAATKRYVDNAVASSGVSTFNTRSGNVTLNAADVSAAGANTLQVGVSGATTPAPLSVGGQGITYLTLGGIGTNIALAYQSSTLYAYVNGVAAPAIAMQPWVTAGFLGLGGGALTGPLTLAADPTVALGTATKQYVDASATAAATAISRNKGRNFAHNPMFNVFQRSGAPYTTDGYTLDRWKVTHSGSDTYSISRLALTDADRAAIGDEAFEYALRNVFVGSSVAGSAHYITHGIEDVRRLSGKTVTVSMWARASTALNLRGLLYQVMGTGGSPSGGVQVGANDWALTAAWQRVTWTQAIPSMSGLVTGTNGDSNTSLILYYSAQGAFVQSGTIDITGVQVEVAAAASAFDKPEPEADFRNCERFYQLLSMYLGIYNTAVGEAAGTGANFRTQMRGAPSLAVTFNGSSNFNVGVPGLQGSQGVFMGGSSQAATNTAINLIIGCNAEY